MTPPRIAALALGAILVAAAVYVAFLRGGDVSAKALLDASAAAMAGASFSTVLECTGCDAPGLLEFAPPDRLRLSNRQAYEQWPFALYTGGKVFVSSEGRRWLEGASPQVALLLLTDLRFLLRVTTGARLSGSERIDGRDTSVVATKFSYELYVAELPQLAGFPSLDDEYDEFRRIVDGAVVRFWIDREDHRILQVEFAPPGAADEVTPWKFDYSTPVTIPDQVESMPGEQAQALGRQSEPAGQTLLTAIQDYYATYEACPPAVDPQTLSEFLPPDWPTNVFTGRPIRNAPDSPGDFDYRLTPDGGCEFTLAGWDGATLYSKSEWFHGRE